MRYQNFDRVDEIKLRDYAGRFKSPRLERAIGRWLVLAVEEEEGVVML
ncbi:MAG: hypothetical protein IPO77_20010 [Acidobacteria bacterium]|nr:hypothetical protein [Acidobacteriota bacterium]